MSCPAPPAMQLHRYLPLTLVRIVVDSKQNDLSGILTEKHFGRLAQKVRRHMAQDIIRHTRPQLIAMIEQAEQLAANHETGIVDAARARMQKLQQSELERLQALAEINPNIRKEEIEHLVAETAELHRHLATTHIKLDAIRVAVITEQA